LTPARRREIVAGLRVTYRVSERRACRAMAFPRSSQRYRATRDPQHALRIRLKDLAGARVRYGYRRLHVLLRREGWEVNHKRVYRLYTEEGLTMRRKRPRRHVSARARSDRPAVEAVDQAWAMDFMRDTLSDGRAIRLLTVLDLYTRECLAIRVDFRFTGDRVVRVLEGLAAERRAPEAIRVDNGPEFRGRMLDLWAYFNGVALDFSEPGKPTDNAFIESFNGRFREECLDLHWFTCLEDARSKTGAWRLDYNHDRPHGSLGNLAPGEFAKSRARVSGPDRGSKLA
jgi:putative transposase